MLQMMSGCLKHAAISQNQQMRIRIRVLCLDPNPVFPNTRIQGTVSLSGFTGR